MTRIQTFSIPCDGSCGRSGSHTVRVIGDKFSCCCPGFVFRRQECKHVRAVKAQIKERLIGDLKSLFGAAIERKRNAALGDFERDILDSLLNSIFESQEKASPGTQPGQIAGFGRAFS